MGNVMTPKSINTLNNMKMLYLTKKRVTQKK